MTMWLFRNVGAFLTVGLMLMASPLHAQEKPRFALYDFFPYGTVNVDGTYGGIFYELAKVIEKKSGIAFSYAHYPIPRAFQSVSSNLDDLIISGSKVKGAQSLGRLGCHWTVVLPSVNAGIDSLRALDGKNIGFLTGGIHHRNYSVFPGLGLADHEISIAVGQTSPVPISGLNF